MVRVERHSAAVLLQQTSGTISGGRRRFTGSWRHTWHTLGDRGIGIKESMLLGLTFKMNSIHSNTHFYFVALLVCVGFLRACGRQHGCPRFQKGAKNMIPQHYIECASLVACCTTLCGKQLDTVGNVMLRGRHRTFRSCILVLRGAGHGISRRIYRMAI
jgi:hypothetical protein